jgi:hypothetical protein
MGLRVAYEEKQSQHERSISDRPRDRGHHLNEVFGTVFWAGGLRKLPRQVKFAKTGHKETLKTLSETGGKIK